MWQTVNEVCKRKSTSRAKLKATSQEKWIHMWKEYFKHLLGKSPKVTDKPITKIVNNQPDIKLGQEELNIVQSKIKNRVAAGLDEMPPEVGEKKKCDDGLLWYCNAVYN